MKPNAARPLPPVAATLPIDAAIAPRRRLHRSSTRLPLEQRFMFDGAAVVDAAHAAPEAAARALIPAVPAAVEVRAADPGQEGGKKEVVFIDTSVTDYRTLEDAVRAGVEVVEISAGESGLAQIARWAENHSGYDAIHLMGHGSEAVLHLGSDTLTSSSMSTTMVQAELAQLGHALKAGGDLLVYGCDLAQGADGQAWVARLAQTTGADVAASVDATGAAGLGGNWTLEKQDGQIDAASPFDSVALQSYSGLLTTFDFTDATGSGSKIVQQTIGSDTVVFTATDQRLSVDTDSNLWGGGIPNVSGNVLMVGEAMFYESKLRIAVAGGKLFDLSSFTLVDWAGENKGLWIVTDKGQYAFAAAFSNGSWDVSLSGAAFTEIRWAEIRTSDPSWQFSWAFDNVVLNNIHSPAPALTAASYDASSHQLSVTANTLTAGDSIDTGKLTLTGQGGSSYTLTSGTVTATSSGFSVTLNAADQAGVAALLTENGASSADGNTYNIAGAAGWDASQATPADLSGNGITVYNASNPLLNGATYDVASNLLTVYCNNMVAGDSIDTSKLSLIGQGGGSYTLTSGIVTATASGFTVSLNTVDQDRVEGLLNANGTVSLGGTGYRLTGANNWDASRATYADNNNGITVSNMLNATYGFESALDWTANSATLRETVSGETLQVTGADWEVYPATYFGDPVISGAQSLDLGINGTLTSASFSLTDGKLFTLASMRFNSLGHYADYILESSKGQIWFSNSGSQIDISAHYNAAYFQNISQFTLKSNYGNLLIGIDDLVTTNIHTAQPTTTITSTAFSADTGSSSDFITNASSQTVSGVLSANLLTGETVLVSLDNGTTWNAATASVGSNTWSLAGQTLLAGNNTLKVKVSNSGGDGAVRSQSYTLDTTGPTTTVASAAFANDTGTSSSDFITSAANQTVSGTLSANLVSGEAVYVSLDDGTTWIAATASVGSNAWSLAGQTLSASNTLKVKLTDTAGNDGSVYAQTYTLDTTAPTTSVASAAFSNDTGSSSTDFLTKATNQTISGTLSTNLAAGEIVQVSLDNGATWSAASASVGSNTWSQAGQPLTASNTLKVKVSDTAGNDASVYAQAYVLDTTGPGITFSNLALSNDTGSSNSDFITVTAAQTLTATLSAVPGGTDIVYGSFDNGSTWTDITSKVSGTTLTWTGITLTGSNTLKLKVTDAAGNDGTVTSQAYALDNVAPAAPAAPDLASAADAGISSTDDLTNVTTPSITGTAEAGSTVTLYDTNGSTVLGTGTADGSGNWSITASALSAGAHTLTTKATDAAGNTSGASSALNITVETTPPTGLAVSSTLINSSFATSAATIATLSATDDQAITYSLASGNGSNDADNGRFSVSGSALNVGGTALTAGTYHIYVAATDAAGNATYQALTLNVVDGPSITSVVRTGGASAIVAGATSSITYTVTFDQAVTGVDTSDFALTATGTAAGTVASVSGSGTTYTVTVNSLAGDGTLRLDLKNSGTGILNTGSVAIISGYTSGDTYTLDRIAPSAPSAPDLTVSTDTGRSDTDNVTNNTTPTFSGTAEANSTVTLYDTNGTTVLGTATADGAGNWSITATTLAAGNQTLSAKATDAVGNTSVASSGLTVTIDTAAPIAPSAPDLTAGTDTGSSGSDNLTYNTTPTFTGNAEANSIVSLYDTNGTTLLGTGTADGSGNWSITASTLSAGNHSLTAKTTDTAGNTSAVSSNLNVTIDTTAPLVASVSVPANGSYLAGQTLSFTVNTDEAVIVDSGSGTPRLVIDMGGSTVYASYASGSGSTALVFTYTVQAGDTDSNGITVGALQSNGGSLQDAAGNNLTLTLNSVASTAAVLVDTTAPGAPSAPDMSAGSDSGSSSTDNITSNTTPTFTGTAEASSTVKLYDTDGTTLLGTTTADGSGNWSITSAALAEGTHSLTARATDTAGNTSVASSGLAITIDTTAPIAPSAPDLVAGSDSGNSNADNLTNATTPTLTGTAEANSIVTLFDTDGTTLLGTTTADGSGNWSITSSVLAEGSHTLTTKATDAAGNVSVASSGLTVVIDTTAPVAPSAPDMSAASDSGTSSTDNITSNTTPIFTGTAEANSTVKLYDTDGTTLLGTTTADGSGNWSITSAALAEGAHTLTTKATDAAGNTSAASAGLAITIDTSAPIAPSAPDLSTGSDSGSSSTDNITSNTTPTFTGTAEASSTVKLYDTDGTTLLGTTTADGSGNWSITSVTLAAGSHTLTTKATDTAGNVSVASSALNITIDTTAPVAPSAPDLLAASDSGNSNADNLTNATTPTLTGTAEANSIVTLFDTDGTTVLGTTTADGSGNWSITSSALTTGSHTLTTKATDAAGNVSVASSGLTVVIDTTAPVAPSAPDMGAASDSGSSSTDNITSNTTPIFTGTAEANSTVKLYDTDGTTLLGTTTADGSGNWSITSAALSEGAHTLTTRATDAAGNTSAASAGLAITIDTSAPIAPSTPDLSAGSDSGSSSTDNITSNTTPTFTGTAEANSTVKLYDTDGTTLLGTTTADGSGNWSISSTALAEGTHTLTTKATDTAGNTSVASSGLAVTIDTTAPVAPSAPDLVAGSDSGNSNADNLTNATTPMLTGTAEANSIVTLFDTDGTTLLGTTTADGSGNWSITSSVLAEGSHTLTTKATDAAGNVSVASSGLTVVIDTTAPVAPSAPDMSAASDSGTSSTDNITSNTTPTFTGTAEANSTVKLYDTDGTTLLGTTTADGSGNWSITSAALSEGAHTLTTRATDAAGNTSIASSLAVIIDRTAPTITFSDLALSSDTGSSSSDFITLTASQTITATLSAAPAGGDVVSGSLDGGATWSDITSQVAGTTLTWNGVTLSGSSTLLLKVTDAAGNDGSVASQAYVLDNTAPLISIDALTVSTTTPILTGSANEGTLTVTVGGATYLVTPANGTWHLDLASSTPVSGTLSMQPGNIYRIDVVATDTAGNSSTASNDINVIFIPPQIIVPPVGLDRSPVEPAAPSAPPTELLVRPMPFLSPETEAILTRDFVSGSTGSPLPFLEYVSGTGDRSLLNARQGSGGEGLRVLHGMADQLVAPAGRSEISVPADLFADMDPNASVQLFARQSNGQALPDWIIFDARTGKFIVNAPRGVSGELSIKLVARDAKGHEISTTFKIRVGTRQAALEPSGRPGLSEQIRQAARHQGTPVVVEHLAKLSRSLSGLNA